MNYIDFNQNHIVPDATAYKYILRTSDNYGPFVEVIKGSVPQFKGDTPFWATDTIDNYKEVSNLNKTLS